MINQLGGYCPVCNPQPRCPCCGNPTYYGGYQQFPYVQWQATSGYAQATSTGIGGIQGAQHQCPSQGGQTAGGAK